MPPTRRDFLRSSLGTAGLISAGAGLPTLLPRPSRAAARPSDAGETILVVLQLAGGNDGLNTVVPFEDDHYHRNRPTLREVAKRVHKIDSLLGLHPQMEAFAELYREGLLGIVQGVGYPRPSGDHGAAMRDWQTGRPHEANCQTGWLGRAVDGACGAGRVSVPAVFVGQIPRPLALNAENVVAPSVQSLEQCTLHTIPAGPDGQTDRRRLVELARLPRAEGGGPLLGFLRRGSREALAGSERIEAAARAPDSAGSPGYPPLQLARRLKIIGRLVRAELGIRIFCTELGGPEPGGFDNHANQRHNHGALLRQLSDSVAAFANDLKRDKLLDRVLLMTFSEFGRTVKENGRRGTGHGSAAPLFLVGGRVKPGLLGEHPNLTDLENGGQKFHTDFRRIYATVLECWLGFDGRTALGGGFPPLDALRT